MVCGLGPWAFSARAELLGIKVYPLTFGWGPLFFFGFGAFVFFGLSMFHSLLSQLDIGNGRGCISCLILRIWFQVSQQHGQGAFSIYRSAWIYNCHALSSLLSVTALHSVTLCKYCTVLDSFYHIIFCRGRRITSAGQRDLDRIAGQVAAAAAELKKE